MRIRTIKPQFFTHEELYALEVETKLPIRIAFAGLWCAADREGRFKWEPRRLGIQILPYDQVDFSRVLHALTTRGLLVRYRVGDVWFGAIPSWKKHQFINNKETPSEIPDVLFAEEVDASVTREPRVDHAIHKEGKGKEGKGNSSCPKSDDSDEVKFVEWFLSLLSETGAPDPKLSNSTRESWADCYRKMIELDGRSKDDVARVCRWARNDSFWAKNFMSPMKLREKKDGVMYFDQFLNRMQSGGASAKPLRDPSVHRV